MLKRLKNVIMMMKIVHQFQSKKKIFNKLADERLKEITELDKKVKLDDLDTKVKALMKNLINMIMLWI